MQSADTSERNSRPAPSLSPKARAGHNTRKRNEDERSTKRSRVAQACEECRARKVRCDGGHPVCGPCRRRNRTLQECVYQADRSNPGISLQYVANLEDTIRRLVSAGQNGGTAESALGQPAPEVSPHHGRSEGQNAQIQQQPKPMIPAVGARATQPGAPPQDEDTISPRSNNRYTSGGESPPTTFSNRDEVVDGMGNIGILESSYGIETSSTASFMKMVKDAVATRLALPGHDAHNLSQPQHRPLWGEFNPPHSLLPAAELYVLPFKKTADDMVGLYFDEVHILYPFLHRARFMRSYNALWTDGERIADGLTYCILNMMFAIYCQVTKKDSPEEKGVAADIFLRRAKQLLQTELLGSGSLELIQALLLMGQYFQSSEWPHRCWVVIGIAIRVSQGLGLHLPKTTANLRDQQDRELARRLWHGCVFMDRMVSMTLGRPLMISRADALSVPLPTSSDDECLLSHPAPENIQAPHKPSTTEFYVQSLQLFTITEETLTAMYSVEASDQHAAVPYLSPLEKLETLDFTTIIKIDSSLQKWNASLPPYLKVRKTPVEELAEPMLSRQANILHLRYLQIQILLFRPILSLLLTPDIRSLCLPKSSARPWLPQAMALPCARNGILAALESIDLIFSRQNKSLPNPPPVETLPAWWYEVFFAYTAATALIPARIYAHIRGDITLPTLREGWCRALHILSSLSPLSSSAKRCLTALQLINDQIVAEECTYTAEDLAHGENHMHPHARIFTQQPGLGRDGGSVQAALQQLPELGDLGPTDGDGFGVMQGLQDFAWLDSLPVDLGAGGYADLMESLEAQF